MHDHSYQPLIVCIAIEYASFEQFLDNWVGTMGKLSENVSDEKQTDEWSRWICEGGVESYVASTSYHTGRHGRKWVDGV